MGNILFKCFHWWKTQCTLRLSFPKPLRVSSRIWLQRGSGTHWPYSVLSHFIPHSWNSVPGITNTTPDLHIYSFIHTFIQQKFPDWLLCYFLRIKPDKVPMFVEHKSWRRKRSLIKYKLNKCNKNSIATRKWSVETRHLSVVSLLYPPPSEQPRSLVVLMDVCWMNARRYTVLSAAFRSVTWEGV